MLKCAYSCVKLS